LRICFFILNSFDYDSRARLICHDILARGWRLDIIATTGSSSTIFEGAPIYRIPQHSWPSRKYRFVEYNIKAAKIAASLKADIYHAVDLDTLWAASRAAEKTHGRLLYESRELYTELLALEGRSLVKAFWRNLEHQLIRDADSVVTINSAIAKELSRRYAIPEPPVVMNVAAKVPQVKPVDLRREFNLDCKRILIYQGILRPGQGILRAVDIISELPDTGLVYFGDGPLRPDIERKAAKLGIEDRISFAGMVPSEKLPAYTAGADAGLLLMEPVALNNRLALPQKLFQYISAGVPPIVTSLPCLKEIVEKDNLGLVLNETPSPEDSGRIAAFLNDKLGAVSANCIEAAKIYCWDIEGQKLIRIYESLVK
jgi:glycosyltransferase involved in cell wall biosynthesis